MSAESPAKQSDVKGPDKPLHLKSKDDGDPDGGGGPIQSFEGPEKVLEVWFRPSPDSKQKTQRGLRDIDQDTWQKMLDLVHCKIMSKTGNECFDSFVLSESSLFVYPRVVLLKTCGTTTLLHAVPMLLEIASQCGLDEVEDAFYSRKSFMYPDHQLYPHSSWSDECNFLDEYFDGSGYVMGRTNGDHWYLYLTDAVASVSSTEVPDQTLEILMTDLDQDAMKLFYKDKDFVSTEHVTKTSGIADLLPGMIVDDFMFDPCGYSMNGLLKDAYCTIHITPQSQCSYASFETNVNHSDYTELIMKVLAVFRPRNFTVTLFVNMHTAPALNSQLPAEYGEAKRQAKMLYEFENNYKLLFCHYQKPKPARAISTNGIKQLEDMIGTALTIKSGESSESASPPQPASPSLQNLSPVNRNRERSLSATRPLPHDHLHGVGLDQDAAVNKARLQEAPEPVTVPAAAAAPAAPTAKS